MGVLASRALRPLKSFNIENRAERIISKEKPTPAPKYPSNIEDLKRTIEAVPDLDEKLDKKDPALDARLKDVYVTSYGRPENDITKERIENNPNRPLPQDKKTVEDFELGFKEPDKVPYGRVTLRNVVDFITAHQVNPEEVTAAKIAFEYKLKESDVADVLKYYKTYEIFLPETKSSKALFAGAANLRKQLEENKLKQLEAKKEADNFNEGGPFYRIRKF